MVPTAFEFDWSTNFAKALTPALSGPNGAYRQILGHPLELVPQSEPWALEPGDVLPVLVLLNGRPLAGAMVESTDGKTPLREADIPRYRSGPDGIAQIPVTRTGLQLLAVDYAVPAKDLSHIPASLYNATFSFVLPGSVGSTDAVSGRPQK